MALGYEEIVKLLTKIKKDTPIKAVMGLEKVRIIEGLFQSYDKEQETMSILTRDVRKAHSFKCGMDSTKYKNNVYVDIKNIHIL